MFPSSIRFIKTGRVSFQQFVLAQESRKLAPSLQRKHKRFQNFWWQKMLRGVMHEWSRMQHFDSFQLGHGGQKNRGFMGNVCLKLAPYTTYQRHRHAFVFTLLLWLYNNRLFPLSVAYILCASSGRLLSEALWCALSEIFRPSMLFMAAPFNQMETLSFYVTFQIQPDIFGTVRNSWRTDESVGLNTCSTCQGMRFSC